MSDLLIEVSFTKNNGENSSQLFKLKDYNGFNGKNTPYGYMRNDVIAFCRDRLVQWVSISMVIGNSKVYEIFHSDYNNLENIESFRTFIGSMGSGEANSSEGIGIIDKNLGIRIDYDNHPVIRKL